MRQCQEISTPWVVSRGGSAQCPLSSIGSLVALHVFCHESFEFPLFLSVFNHSRSHPRFLCAVCPHDSLVCTFRFAMSLSSEEQKMLQALLLKAHGSDGSGASSDAFSDGSFSVVTDKDPLGAVTDGSKRRDDSTPVEVTAKKYGISTGPATFAVLDGAASHCVPYASSSECASPKYPEVNGVQLYLPPKVPGHLGTYCDHLGKVQS